jgi:branched-chain amino acid transport system substrate-binding protein
MACSGSSSGSKGKPTDAPLTIGALLPLTGALASYGETSNAALVEAAATINATGANKLGLMVEDTKTDPPTALAKLQSLHDKGVRVVIGPYSSSEVKAVLEYANKNGMVLISPLSTATTLAITNDNLFRFTPDDELEAKAVAALALADGIKTILPVTRDDEGNRGLQTAMKTAFEAGGGHFMAGVTYTPDQKVFTTQAQSLAALLADSKAPTGSVGVYLTGFAEVGDLFTATAAMPGLQALKWYGSDSVAQSKDLVENTPAAAFAAAAGYPNPILGVSDLDKALWQPVSDRIKQKLGRAPDAFAFASYDALTVAYKALTSASPADLERLKRALVSTSLGYRGLTGAAILNPAGDRAAGNYDFWSVCSRAGQYTWVRTISYTAAVTGPGQIARPEAC